MTRKAMVCGPLEGHIDPDTGVFNLEARMLFEGVITELENRGYQVYSAHRIEEYGKKPRNHKEFTHADNQANKESDLVVAILGEPAARSTHTELGWTTARGKDLIFLLEKGHDYCSFMDGFKPTFGNVQYVRHNNYKEAITGLSDSLRNVEHKIQEKKTFLRGTTTMAVAASLTIAFGVGHLTESYRTDRQLKNSRVAVMEDYAKGLVVGGEFQGEYGTVISQGNKCALYPTGWDPVKLRIYGIDRDIAQKKVLGELINQK